MNESGTTRPDLGAILGGHLRRLLEVDRRLHLHFSTPSGTPLYGTLAGEGNTSRDADLCHLDRAVARTEAEFLNRDLSGIAPSVIDVADSYGVPEDEHVALGLGLLHAELRFWKAARERLLHGSAPPLDAEAAGGTTPGAPPAHGKEQIWIVRRG